MSIDWVVESVGPINYTTPSAVYNGVIEVFGEVFRQSQEIFLRDWISKSLEDSENVKWVAVSSACNTITLNQPYEWDFENKRIVFEDKDEFPPSEDYQWLGQGKYDGVWFDSLEELCFKSIESWGDPNVYFSGAIQPLNCVSCNRVSERCSSDAHATARVDRFEPIKPKEKRYASFDEITEVLINDANSENSESLFAQAYIDHVAKTVVVPIFDSSVLPTEPPTYSCNISSGFINYQEKARERYTYLFDNPEFDAIVQTILEHRMKRQCEYLTLKDSILDIDKSSGVALDIIGKLVGQPRVLLNFIVDPYFGFLGARKAQSYNVGQWYTLNAASKGTVKLLSDEQYRRVIKARIIKNHTRNSRKDFVSVLKLLGGTESSLIVRYLRNGVIEVNSNSDSDPDGLIGYFLSKYLETDSIIPRPLGYRIGQLYEEVRYLTSLLYPISSGPEDINNTASVDVLIRKDIVNKYSPEKESVIASADVEMMSKKDVVVTHDLAEKYQISSDASVDFMQKRDIVTKLSVEDEGLKSTTSLDSIVKKSVVISHNNGFEDMSQTSSIDEIKTSLVWIKEPFNISYRVLE